MVSFVSFHILNYIENTPPYYNEDASVQKISSLLLEKGHIVTRPLLMTLGAYKPAELQMEEIQWERHENGTISCWITFMNPKNLKKEEFITFIKNLKKALLTLETRWEEESKCLYLSYKL